MIQAGQAIGPYTLVRTLGRGAFGEVWLAERRSSLITTQVALKLPLDADAGYPPGVEAIRQEAQVWLRASGHPNVVPVMDAEVYDGQVVIASEYIAGGSLVDWLNQHGGKAASVEAAVRMARGILDGLQHLHETGLVHRDLKPGNVLIQKGKPRLADFGLTRVLKQSGNTTQLAGTPAYMAPEAFRGEYSPASDVWAVAVLLHKLLCGSLPYMHKDFYALQQVITSHQPVVLSDQIPDALRPILAKALAKRVEDRIATAVEMSEELDAPVTSRAAGSTVASLRTDRNLPAQKTALTCSEKVIAEDKALLTKTRRLTNLPRQMTSFIGRGREMDEVKRLLPSAPLLTLVGTGGVGKTRLALQLGADALDDYEDGVWFVELASLSDPELVPQTVANVLGLREETGRPVLQIVQDYLHDRHLLLILDNCEHVLDVCRYLADSLLKNCPQLTILATSRETLGIAGERTWRVPSLLTPGPVHPTFGDKNVAVVLMEYDACRLFVERAKVQRQDFVLTRMNVPTVAHLCQQLDGIPLAIELAAARVRSLSVEEINSKLDSRFRLLTGGSRTALPRHQTLRALIDWSYDQLNDQEKALLCRLSVFAGGWTLEAAEVVGIGPDTEDGEVLDLLTSLVDKSLVMAEQEQGQTRYRMLETIRQYAQGRLEERGEEETVQERHQAFFVVLAEEAEPQLLGPEQVGSSRVDLQACKLEYSIVSPK